MATHSSRANHDDRALRVCREAERGPADMDGRFDDSALSVGTAGSVDGVDGAPVGRNKCWFRLGLVADQRHDLASRSILEVKQEVGTDTVHPARLETPGLLGLVLEHDGGDVNGIGVQLGAGGDGIVPGLETRDGRNDDVEGNLPSGGVLHRGVSLEIVTCGVLQDFTELHASGSDYGRIMVLVRVQLLECSLCLGRGCELRQNTKYLTTSKGADVDVVTEHSAVCRGDGEGYLGQSGIERLDVDDCVTLVVETQRAKQTLDFDIRVERPDTDVITVLIRDTRSLGAELDVNTVPVRTVREELASVGDRRRVRVLCIVNALGPRESARGQFACMHIRWDNGVKVLGNSPRYTFSAGWSATSVTAKSGVSPPWPSSTCMASANASHMPSFHSR